MPKTIEQSILESMEEFGLQYKNARVSSEPVGTTKKTEIIKV